MKMTNWLPYQTGVSRYASLERYRHLRDAVLKSLGSLDTSDYEQARKELSPGQLGQLHRSMREKADEDYWRDAEPL